MSEVLFTVNIINKVLQYEEQNKDCIFLSAPKIVATTFSGLGLNCVATVRM